LKVLNKNYELQQVGKVSKSQDVACIAVMKNGAIVTASSLGEI
jgi:hypothetical protein